MKNNIFIAGALVVVIVIGFFFVPKSKNSEEKKPIIETIQKKQAGEGSRYVSFTNDIFEQSKNTRRVLYFYANWCPTCRPVDAEFEANNSNIPEDVTVIRVNYNDSDTDSNEIALAKKYAITYQHTFVQIDQQENQVAIWNGGGFSDLLSQLK